MVLRNFWDLKQNLVVAIVPAITEPNQILKDTNSPIHSSAICQKLMITKIHFQLCFSLTALVLTK